MSGICGLILSNDSIDIHDYSQRMLHGLSRFNHYSTDSVITENVMLGQVNIESDVLRGGKQKIRNTDSWVFSGHCRLDDKKYVMSSLGLSSTDKDAYSDIELIETFIRRNRDTNFCSAFGDWIISGWNKADKTLVIAREHHGQKPLYYVKNRELFAFSTALESLLVLPSVEKKIRDIYIAKSMTRWDGENDYLTCFENIHFLPPASMLTFEGNQISVRRFWKMEENIEINNNISQAEAIEATGALLQKAVDSRVCTKLNTSSMLSSGLDSSSVAMMAAKTLSESNVSLDAYCSIPLYPENTIVRKGRTANEAELAKLIANSQPNIKFHTVDSADISPIQGIEHSIASTCQPFYATSNDHWINSVAKQSQSDGNHVLLNGGLGNITFSFAGRRANSITEDLRSLKFRRALSKSRWKRPVLDVRKMLLLLKTGGNPWREYSPINKKFVERLNLVGLMKVAGHDPTFYTTNLHQNSLDERLEFLAPKIGAGVLWDALSRTHGMDVLDPTSDTALVLYTLGLPDRVFIGPNDEPRWLAKQVSSFLPRDVLINQVRGLQAADLVHKLRQDATRIEYLLDDFSKDPYVRDVIDLKLVNSIWHDIKNNPQPDFATHMSAYGIFLNAIATGLFIRKYT